MAFLELQLTPAVAKLNDRERLNVHSGAGCRGVVHHAGQDAARLGADGEDIAAVADRNERFLE